jgi:hypothetical protein
MKFIVRWLFRLLLLLLVLTVAALLLKDSLLQEFAETRLRQRTGLVTQIGRLEAHLLSPTLTLQDAKLFNPAEFGGTPFLEIPDAFLEYDRLALATGRLRWRLIRLHVAELVVVRDAQGRANLPVIRAQLAERATHPRFGTLRFGGIDTLNLTLERICVYQVGSTAPPATFHLGLRHEVLRDLRTPADLEQALLALVARLGLAPFLPPPAATNNPAARTLAN